MVRVLEPRPLPTDPCPRCGADVLSLHFDAGVQIDYPHQGTRLVRGGEELPPLSGSGRVQRWPDGDRWRLGCGHVVTAEELAAILNSAT